MLSPWEHAESHKLFLNLSELIQILVYFITLCPGGPCRQVGTYLLTNFCNLKIEIRVEASQND